MTVASVKELVDKAILKVHRGKLGKKVSGRDWTGTVVLSFLKKILTFNKRFKRRLRQE